MSRSDLMTLPNILSLSRLAFAPLFLLLRQPEARLALVVAAALTDMLDGWLARQQRSTTRTGAILDPLADRLFVLTVLLTFVMEGALTVGQVLLILTRDIATTVGFVVARAVPWLRSVVLRARPLGKVVTGLQIAVLIAVLIAPPAVQPLVIATALLSVLATADYTLMLWREREER